MATRFFAVVAVVVAAICVSPSIGIASSLSVHAIYDVDVFPQGDFEDSTKWTLTTQSGYTSEPAEYTQSIIADSRLSFTHSRGQNLKSMTFWSLESSSGHSSAALSPDGIVSISAGPNIMVNDFDLSSVNESLLVSAALVISFRITDGLSDDRVEFSITWSEGSELLKTYANTIFQGEINHLESPYESFQLGGADDWSWAQLETMVVDLNYESQAPDDAQLEVDAVGLQVTWQAQESGFDFLKAISDFSVDQPIDYSNPVLEISGSISGSLDGVDSDFSWIRVSMGDDVVADISILGTTTFDLLVPLENISLPSEGNMETLGIGVKIYWDSEGQPGEFVVSIEELTLIGATHTEWDFDPECIELADLTGASAFHEDSSYLIEPILESCSDDRTEILSLVASSSNESLLNVIVEDGHLKVYPVPDSYGFGSVDVSVSDASGNYWNDTFWIEVMPINDLPLIEGLPDEVWIKLGDHLVLNSNISDVDTDISNLDLDSNKQFASIGENFSVIITPTSAGVTLVTLTLWDGVDSVEKEIIVNAYSESDLVPLSLYPTPEISTYNVGDIIELHAIIANEGALDATFVTVRCYANQELIGNKTLAIVPAHQTGEVVFDWMVSGEPSSTVYIKLVVDSSESIVESNEHNNEMTLEIVVGGNQDTSTSALGVAENLFSEASLPFSILVALGLISAVFILAPSRIRRAN